MIRPTIPEDTTALIALADATGLFPPSGLELLRQMLTNSLAKDSDTAPFWITDDDREPVGVAYCEPERMTDSTWNLQLIAIHPNRQGQGRGRKLLHYVEQALMVRGGRMLLVETSGLPELERTRGFYLKCGYEEEARIRDFYATGDDKVVFRKVLNAN
ncbi:GNAT family N-acetyltransferase [Aliterella atlantica]|uniref:Acetyltransferase n=1 Tax=Aliterella atlantica CENA595 TaxID=1618023 RepID=A0A0D8ZME3_9CYAN|nr:GNAT family N-acetyltransferase [Aliterella atlantica]KJH69910.1 acetyltransferase [Aliterella atlantica CENA595]